MSTARSAAALAFGTVAPLCYFAQRAFEVASGTGEDPSLVLAQSHVGFYWRCGVAVWLAAVSAWATYMSVNQVPKRGERIARCVRAATVPLALIYVVLAVVAP